MNSDTESPEDVFDMSRTVPAPGACAGAESDDIVKATPKKSVIGSPGPLLETLKKRAVPAGLALAFTVGSLWIFMPGLFSFGGSSNSAPARPLAQTSLSPADAMRKAGRAHSQEPRLVAPESQNDFDRGPVVVLEAPPTVAGPKVEPKQTDAVVVTNSQVVSTAEKELPGRVVVLEQAIADLQAKVALLEGRPVASANAIDTGANSAKAGGPTKDSHKVKKGLASGAVGANKTFSKPVSKALVNSTFTLNTIYPGQAWIQDSEQMHVVREGDSVGGLQILQIDQKNRRVVTTRGDIR